MAAKVVSKEGTSSRREGPSLRRRLSDEVFRRLLNDERPSTETVREDFLAAA